MSRKTVKMIAFIIIIAMVVTSFSFIFFLPTKSYGAENLYAATTAREQQYLNEQIRELENYIKLIHDNYKDEVEYKTLMDGAFEGAMYSLGDPYSVYFSDPVAGQSFVETSSGEYEGVGVGIGINDEGLCEVTSLMFRGPADRAGVKKGDIVVSIDGSDVTKKPLQDISSLLKGKAGTTVKMTVKRGDEQQVFMLTREKIKTTSVYYEKIEGDIGYIMLTGFTVNAAEEFKTAKAELIRTGAKSLIIDVRDNPGGLVNIALEIADQLLEKGAIVHFEQKGKIFETVYAEDKTLAKIPVVLLMNEYSASASEILAGALKENNAATLVGTTTFGKGAAQLFGYTTDGAPYKISIYYFLSPDKNNIESVGVAPDYAVKNSIGEFREEAAEMYKLFAPFAENTKPAAGDVGLNVYAAQQRLALLGYGVSATAVMDEATVSAIRQFQRENGLYAGGVLDFTTKAKIEEVTLLYISGETDADLQLKKAIELLKR